MKQEDNWIILQGLNVPSSKNSKILTGKRIIKSKLCQNYIKWATPLLQSQKEKWEKFIYENDTYKVIYPDKPELLAKEGIELRHCVKSYIDRVIDGVTNILFIRKQEDIDYGKDI